MSHDGVVIRISKQKTKCTARGVAGYSVARLASDAVAPS
jgi:hypothetical protein